MGLSLARQRFTAILLTVFAAIALALAAVGTYGVMAYLVGQGTRDIGIAWRWARAGRILAMVVRQGTWLAAAGVGAGLAAAFALSRFLAALLFGVSALDPADVCGRAGAPRRGGARRVLRPGAPGSTGGPGASRWRASRAAPCGSAD